MDKTTPSGHFREHLLAPSFDIFYGAPALVVICALADDDMAVQDCSLAAQNLMLAAHDKGLGSCWIGFAEGWLAQPEARAELGLPENARPVAPIILGHPAAQPPPPGRDKAKMQWVRGPLPAAASSRPTR
jgi:nitroreductase